MQILSDGVLITIRWRSNQSQPANFWNPWSNKSEWWPPEGDTPWNLLFSSQMFNKFLSFHETELFNFSQISLVYHIDLKFHAEIECVNQDICFFLTESCDTNASVLISNAQVIHENDNFSFLIEFCLSFQKIFFFNL